jgi:hypothetical protein
MCIIHAKDFMKKRMQITISEEIKEKMDLSKDFYGGYSGLIEEALKHFLSSPVKPYLEDISDYEKAIKENQWISLEELRKKIK